MEAAHRLGMPGTATMMFGAGETDEDIVTHLLRVRTLQQRTGGFSAFIPWSYQPGNTELGGEEATGTDYLRVLAVSRLVLHNIPNIQASWVTQGGKLAQVALFFAPTIWVGPCLRKMWWQLPVPLSVSIGRNCWRWCVRRVLCLPGARRVMKYWKNMFEIYGLSEG